MHDERKPSGVPYEADDPRDAELWQALEGLPAETPPERMRADFYRELRRQEERRSWWSIDWLFLFRTAAPAALALAIGFGLGRLGAPVGDPAHSELAALRSEVSQLSRSVALAMLRDDSASERLRGVTLVAGYGAADADATRALLAAATTDPVAAVRGAALDALGPRLGEPLIDAGVRRLLLEADSVLVQLSVADLIMRWGSEDLIGTLVEASEDGRLMPDVSQFVQERIRRNRV